MGPHLLPRVVASFVVVAALLGAGTTQLGLPDAHSAPKLKLTGDQRGIQKRHLKVLRRLLVAAKIQRAEVSSVERTLKRQAKVMYEQAEKDVQHAKDLYCPAGDAVLDKYDPKLGRKANISAMLKELELQLPRARQLGCLNHVANPDVYAVDVARSSVPESHHAALVKAGKRAVREGKVQRFLYPPRDRYAYHFEFKKLRIKAR